MAPSIPEAAMAGNCKHPIMPPVPEIPDAGNFVAGMIIAVPLAAALWVVLLSVLLHLLYYLAGGS
jgi:hypothetical protein